MGLFDFIKKMFSEPIEEGPLKLNLEQLESWLSQQSQQAFENANEKLSGIKKNISEEKLNLQVNIKKIEEAVIKNTEIPDRVKHIMEGNRISYIKRINSLIERTNVPDKFLELLEFSSSFDKTMSDFDKDIAKNHRVMQEFFIKESGSISSNIRNIDKHVKNIKETLKENKISHLEKVRNQLSEIQGKIKQKAEFEREIKKEKEEQEKQNDLIRDKENEIKKVKESEDYSEFLTLTNSKQTIEKDLSTVVTSLNHSFSEIEAALKKYTNLNPEDKLAKCYLVDPIKTLTEDKEIKISEIINGMTISIEEGKLDLKNKKKEKIQRELGKLNREYFSDFLEKRFELIKKLSETNSQIESSQAEKIVKQLKQDLEKEHMTLLEQKQILAKTEKELGEINIESLRSNLENEIVSSLEKRIEIG